MRIKQLGKRRMRELIHQKYCRNLKDPKKGEGLIDLIFEIKACRAGSFLFPNYKLAFQEMMNYESQ